MSLISDTLCDVTSTGPAFLESVQEDLAALNAQMAREFHGLAAGLQSSAVRGREVAALSREVAAMAASEDSRQAIAILRQILTDAGKVQGLAEKSERQLREIAGQLDLSRGPLGRLEKLPALLYTIGTLARIEGTRLRNSNVDVSSLAADIDILAEQIEQHVSEIAGEERRLIALVMRSSEELKNVEVCQREQAASLRERTMGVLEPLYARAEASRMAILRIDEQYESIHQSTDKIVMSLQAEDIARQRVEHVQEALREVSALSATPEGNGKAVRILMLQRAQLISTRDLLSQSVGTVLDSLRALSARVEELTGETASLASQTGQDGRSFAEAVQEGLKAVSGILGQYSASAQTVVSTVESVFASVADMTKGANELGRVAFAIRRTALNAIIETSHLGAEGTAMRALGSEVQNITEQSKGDTKIVVDGLRAVEEALKAISGDGSVSADTATSSKVEEVTREVTRLGESVARSGEEIASRFGAVLNLAKELRSELHHAREVGERAGKLNDTFATILGKLDQQIEIMGGHTAAQLTDASEDGAPLEKLYSMKTERDVHLQVFGAPGAASPAETTPTEDLGDGIELF